MKRNILVTGGAGFIGSCFAIQAVNQGHSVVVLDKLSYAGSEENLSSIADRKNFSFVQGDIADQALVSELLNAHDIDWVVNFAAESHVDNSIAGPAVFIETNIGGTYHMLWAALSYWKAKGQPETFRFLHVSTDEVYGELELNTLDKFKETTPYAPNSPYSASKAASDHLVRAWYHTYKLPTLITNCSNNYGPRQHVEKLIPTMIRCCLESKPLPVYGDGKNVRDWIYVEDHTAGIFLALEKGRPGESYCFGGDAEYDNLSIVHMICELVDEIRPCADDSSSKSLITFVKDRLGHDRRYAIDFSKANKELGFQPHAVFKDKLKETIRWYLDV